MPSAVCPNCGGCWKIKPTGIKQREGYSSEWWELEAHPSSVEQAGPITVENRCDGSGKRV